MPGYDDVEFDPPAPVAHTTVTSSTRSVTEVAMLLDTGADVSVVPRAVAAQLGAESRQSGVRLEMFDRTHTEAAVADLTVQLGTYRFRGSFVLAETTHGIIGRNILNLLIVELDGPRLRWSLTAA